MAQAISIGEFRELVGELAGMEVSLPWKGYGSAIFLELGALTPVEDAHARFESGEACLMVEWDWRVESERAVEFGSSSWGAEIKRRLEGLRGLRVERVDVEGRLPELAVWFSNGWVLRTMAAVAGDPRWSVRLKSEEWVGVEGGGLWLGVRGLRPLTAEEEAEREVAERARARWGAPVEEPAAGRCGSCDGWRRVEGEGYLLDYGVCVEEGSPFDGRAVYLKSGCGRYRAADKNG